MDFSDLTEVSNLRWRCQLLYGVLFVKLEWKLKHPETAISQRSLLDTPHILNWPKIPHRLGLMSIWLWNFMIHFILKTLNSNYSHLLTIRNEFLNIHLHIHICHCQVYSCCFYCLEGCICILGTKINKDCLLKFATDKWQIYDHFLTFFV